MTIRNPPQGIRRPAPAHSHSRERTRWCADGSANSLWTFGAV